MLTTTFQILKESGACEEGYKKLAKNLGGIRKYGKDKPIPLWNILKSNGLDDVLWCSDKTQQPEEAEKVFRLMAADFAESVLHIFEKEYPDDNRPRLAIKASRDYANGNIYDADRSAASADARAARAAAIDGAAARAASSAEKEKQYKIAMDYLTK